MLPFRKYALGVAVLAALGALPALGQTPTTLSLDDLLAEVEAASPTLRAARLDAAALATRSDQVALPDPTVAVTAFPYPVLTARGAQRSQWRAEQMMPWPGTLGLRERAADLSAEVAGYEADALALDLAAEVKRAYYALYRVQQLDVLVRSFQHRLGAFSEAAAVRYEVGRGPQGAILQVQLERERLRERLHALARQRETALRTLARLTERPALVLADTVAVEPPDLPAADANLLDLALRLRPEIQALDAAHGRAEAEIALARKAFYPDLGVGVMYIDIADREMPPTADGRDAFGVMLSAKVPLQRGRLRARLEEARLRQAQVEARQDALQTEIATRLADLLYTAQQERETAALYRERLLPQAAATVESTLAAYTTGQADYLAFLDAERARFQIQTGYEEAVGRYLDTTAALERALGTASLVEAGALLEPTPIDPDSDLR